MPFDIIPKSLYPLVPKAIGVPNLLRQGAQLLDTLTLGYLGASDALTEIIGAEATKWGAFDESGQKIAPYESVIATAYQNESRISDYPVEKGAFASYNKVESPFDVIVTLSCGGSEAQRADFMASIETVRKSVRVYTVITPEYTYRNVNFTAVNVQRSTREGAHLIIAQLMGREVRDTTSANYSSPKDPGAFDTREQGLIQIISDPTFDASGFV